VEEGTNYGKLAAAAASISSGRKDDLLSGVSDPSRGPHMPFNEDTNTCKHQVSRATLENEPGQGEVKVKRRSFHRHQRI
jgi:hypothetical protein